MFTTRDDRRCLGHAGNARRVADVHSLVSSDRRHACKGALALPVSQQLHPGLKQEPANSLSITAREEAPVSIGHLGMGL